MSFRLETLYSTGYKSPAVGVSEDSFQKYKQNPQDSGRLIMKYAKQIGAYKFQGELAPGNEWYVVQFWGFPALTWSEDQLLTGRDIIDPPMEERP